LHKIVIVIFRQIELLLAQHALVIHQGQRKPFNEANLKLSEDILEDIKGLVVQSYEKAIYKSLF
jgi:hypothetical protein